MKTIIFGCGDVGTKVKKKLESEGIEIIAFTDNNPKKWGIIYENRPVIAPGELPTQMFDTIAIGVYKAVDTIHLQLTQLGIPDNKIIIPIEPQNKLFVNPHRYSENDLVRIPRESYTSDNTRHYLGLNINITDSSFLQKLNELKDVLKTYNIPRKKVCVVSGAVLQVYGLRESKPYDDIDIIMTSDLRELYGKELVIVSEHIEMHPQNEIIIPDDEIINDVRRHFIFQDIKFMDINTLHL